MGGLRIRGDWGITVARHMVFGCPLFALPFGVCYAMPLHVFHFLSFWWGERSSSFVRVCVFVVEAWGLRFV